MTHTTIESERESGGSTKVAFHTIDITSLDALGSETYDPEAETGVDPSSTGGITVVGQSNTAYLVRWDHVAGVLTVVNVADGTDAAAATAVGEVALKVEGL